ncbi:DUF5360 family protein [Paenibacillus sp. GCM10027626]|uniref:DUF5360 family protein n=1 Tax=Paenibacillus sp. GCM10027626 TaxID=3273411 RepID=UPI00363ECC2E
MKLKSLKSLKWLFLGVDVGFIVYWTITLFHLIPPQFLFEDYNNPLLVAWNWSFFPLDLIISATGLSSLYLRKKRHPLWQSLALTSLVLTFCSGLQAIAFWVIRVEFNPVWWIPNLFLLIYPLFYIPQFVKPVMQQKD